MTITGTSFSGGKRQVDFGTTPATSFTVVSPTTITQADDPAGTGVVNVTVTTANGTSPTSPADQFTYTAEAPTVTSINPIERIAKRRHDGDDHRHLLHRGQRGGFRHYPRHQLHRRQPHHDHSGRPGRQRRCERDGDHRRRHVGDLAR